MDLVIRRASADDAEFIAWTILTAQRGHRPRGWFDIALNMPEPECLAFMQKVVVALVPSQWHVSTFWIAEHEGIPAAALCALPVVEARTTVRAAIAEAARAAGMGEAGIGAIWQRGAYAKSCWSWGDDSNWMIEHVATRPPYRGKGFVQALLSHAFKQGQVKGFRRASIGFYIGNDAAERCYAKAGFALVEEKRDSGFEALTGAPGFRRAERAIDAVRDR
jgi:ribosomal protein S18 acetylase RimI-like enzyme